MKFQNFEVSSKTSPQRALQTATRDPTLPSRPYVPLLIPHIYALFRDIYKERETSACRQHHPCLRFFRDFASAMIPNSCFFVAFTSASFLTRSYSCSFVTFPSGLDAINSNNVKNQLVGKIIRVCRLFHHVVSAVFETRNSCERRHFSTKRTIIL